MIVRKSDSTNKFFNFLTWKCCFGTMNLISIILLTLTIIATGNFQTGEYQIRSGSGTHSCALFCYILLHYWPWSHNVTSPLSESISDFITSLVLRSTNSLLWQSFVRYSNVVAAIFPMDNGSFQHISYLVFYGIHCCYDFCSLAF